MADHFDSPFTDKNRCFLLMQCLKNDTFFQLKILELSEICFLWPFKAFEVLFHMKYIRFDDNLLEPEVTQRKQVCFTK